LPAGLASAEQGAIELDDTEYTNYTSGGSENIVTITVEDDDLNVATALTGDHELLGVADASTTTFTTDNANINSVSKVFDLFDGIAYFTAVSEDNTQVTLNTARAAEVNATIAGTISVGPGAPPNPDEAGATTITPTGDVAPAASAGAGASDNLRIYAIQFESDDTDVGVAADASGDASSGNINNIYTVNVKGDIVNATTGVVTAAQTVTQVITADNAAVTKAILASGGQPVYFSGPSKYWVTAATAINTENEVVTVKVNQLRVIVARYTYDEANTTDYLDDDDDTHQSVTITSTTDPHGLELTLTETGAATAAFEVDVALITEANKDAIDNQVAASSFSTAAGTAHDLENLTDALATTGAAGDGDQDALDAEDVIDFIASDVTGIDNNTTLDDLMAMLLVVSHDDDITVTYDDQGTGEVEASDSAEIDAEAPILTNVSPSDGDYTDDETPQFTVTMVDADSGIDLTSLAMSVYKTDNTETNVSADVSTDPITDGYDLIFIAGTTELGTDPGDGTGAAGLPHDWKFLIKDEVGNIATTDDEDNSGTADRIEYTIDTNAPGLTSAVTGTGIELDDDDDHEQMPDSAWIKVIFDEDLDQDSLQADDFEIDGETPESILFGTDIETNVDAQVGAPVDLANDLTLVYLKMADDLDPDATPEVEVVDDIDDLAGNDVDEDDVDATDGIAPTLTVSVDVTVGEDEEDVTITVTSDEDLIQATINVDVENGVTSASTDVTMTKGTGNSWTGTFEIDDSAVYTVEANANDEAGNSATEDDDTEFEGDEDATITSIQDSAGVALDGATTIQEGAVWIVTTFDEDNEYADDSSDEITITAVSLVDEDDNVIASDIAALMSDDNVVFTLAVDLAPGEYTFEITGEDAVGNETDSDADFEVVEKDPFELSLQPGVNLVSIPGTPSGDAGALSTLFADTEVTSVITYDAAVNANGGNPWLISTKDAATDAWSGDIAALSAGRSYFVETDASATVDILLEDAGVEVPPSVAVYEGWNAVGFWSISGDTFSDLDSYLTSIDWSVAYSYDPTPGQGWKTLRGDAVVASAINDGFGGTVSPTADQGRGYLVYATADGTLTP